MDARALEVLAFTEPFVFEFVVQWIEICSQIFSDMAWLAFPEIP